MRQMKYLIWKIKLQLSRKLEQFKGVFVHVNKVLSYILGFHSHYSMLHPIPINFNFKGMRLR